MLIKKISLVLCIFTIYCGSNESLQEDNVSDPNIEFVKAENSEKYSYRCTAGSLGFGLGVRLAHCENIAGDACDFTMVSGGGVIGFTFAEREFFLECDRPVANGFPISIHLGLTSGAVTPAEDGRTTYEGGNTGNLLNNCTVEASAWDGAGMMFAIEGQINVNFGCSDKGNKQ